MPDIAANIFQTQQRIAKAITDSDREHDSVQLLAVSKTKPAAMVREAIDAGQYDFGENYLQDALEKIHALTTVKEIRWHFIGPIQSNKTRPIAEHFHWVHSVDRIKIAQRLNSQRPDNLPPLNVCLQINLDNEETKSGITPENTLGIAKAVRALPNLSLRGLMAIPKKRDSLTEQQACFEQLAQLRDELQRQLNISLDTLSMGMSADLEAAIAAGSTLVRVGTDIFGKRD